MIVNKPFITLYRHPQEYSWIEDTLRYGLPVKICQEEGEWVRVEQGWLKKSGLIREDSQYIPTAYVTHRGAYVFTEPDTVKGPLLELPFETGIMVEQELQEQHGRFWQVRLLDGRSGFIQQSQLTKNFAKLNEQEVVEFAKLFLGIKYLWGGTTSFGFDCSGFVQMLYRQMGISLPRNSYEQAADIRLISVDEPKACDLVFFRNQAGQVVHVGMMMNSAEFIHAFTKREAWICMSRLQDPCWKNGHFYFNIEIKRFLVD